MLQSLISEKPPPPPISRLPDSGGPVLLTRVFLLFFVIICNAPFGLAQPFNSSSLPIFFLLCSIHSHSLALHPLSSILHLLSVPPLFARPRLCCSILPLPSFLCSVILFPCSLFISSPHWRALFYFFIPPHNLPSFPPSQRFSLCLLSFSILALNPKQIISARPPPL